MSNFRQVDRETGFLLPPSVDEWLPERHLARFVVEVIERLELSAMVKAYRGSGSASYHPSVLLGLVVYGYATGVFSSRKLERATYDSVAFRFIAANDHPDHDTIASFRRRFLKQIEALFVEVLVLAGEMGMLKLGTVALDGTKVHANASRHSALSYEHANKIEAQLRAEVGELMALAEAADQADVPDGMSVPEELARRDARLQRIAEAKAAIEARAKERFAHQQAEHQAQIKAREDKAKRTGRKPPGRPPEPPSAGPRPTDQVNLTDADSRIMPVAGGGFEQAYNAQAAVATGSLLVVCNDVVQAANDKQQVEPMLDKLAGLGEVLGRAETLLADSGYFSEANVEACAKARIAPLIAPGRERHHRSWKERFAAAPPAPAAPTALQAMAHRLATPEGRQAYALRKHTPEPVFGIIKSVMGFRQFHLRGLEKVKGEWNLVTLAWNMKRMFALNQA
ncbi:MAG: IS1182 family transposase [Bradymonadaceae bacterium]|nr:IS1182 family transposase [Lujinxingiaceae bacterium]